MVGHLFYFCRNGDFDTFHLDVTLQEIDNLRFRNIIQLVHLFIIQVYHVGVICNACATSSF